MLVRIVTVYCRNQSELVVIMFSFAKAKIDSHLCKTVLSCFVPIPRTVNLKVIMNEKEKS